jgi:hypothetical protein
VSDYDVYDGDVARRTLTEQDVELILGGAVPPGDDLARFAAVLESLHGTEPSTPPAEMAVAFSTRAAEIARMSRVAPSSLRTPSPRRSGWMLQRRFAGALGAAVLLTGMTGVAVAADRAAPGQALYGLDRAMEAMGIGDGGPPERIIEAQVLFQRGRVPEAIAQAAKAVEDNAGTGEAGEQSPSPEAARAAAALRSAAERVSMDDDAAGFPGVNDSVAGVLGEIAAMIENDDLEPSQFGARISELARNIGRSAEGGEPGSQGGPIEPADENDPSGPPKGTPSGPPDDTPGRPPGGPPGRVTPGPPEDVPGGASGRP